LLHHDKRYWYSYRPLSAQVDGDLIQLSAVVNHGGDLDVIQGALAGLVIGGEVPVEPVWAGYG